jgi:hypothetical protein
VKNVPAILLSGSVGSGKTTLLVEIGALLDERGEPYALVDLDWLAWLRPAPDAAVSVQEVLLENLRAVWATYRAAGVRRLVLARLVESPAGLDAVRAALPGADLFTVRLDVPREVLERRLRGRDSGAELEEHLAVVAAGADPLVFEDAVVYDSGDCAAREIAASILTVAGWLPGP